MGAVTEHTGHGSRDAWDVPGSRHLRDLAAFDAFVRARLPDLLRFGRVLTGSGDAAADLVQDALERTLLAWPRLNERDDPVAYVRRVMVNRNISVWRRLRRETVTDAVPDGGYTDSHRDHEVWRALQSLPTRQRAVLALRYYEDLSEAEIARVLGCSTGTVKSQASKGMAKLRAQVPDREDHERILATLRTALGDGPLAAALAAGRAVAPDAAADEALAGANRAP